MSDQKPLRTMDRLWETEAAQYGADIERVQIWDTLSEFYLDSYQTDADKERVAQILARSPFSLDELRHIELFEVDPVCWLNLHPFGAEWAGFSPDWLIPRCLECQRRSPYNPAKKRSLRERLFRWLIWSNIPEKRIRELRGSAAGENPLPPHA